MTRSVITGIGPISAIGEGVDEFWNNLAAGRCGIVPITRCDVSRSPSKIGAEVADFHLERHVPRGRALARSMPRPVQFALAAASLAVSDARLNIDTGTRGRIGVFMGTSIGQIGDMFAMRDRWLTGGGLTAGGAFQMFTHSAACLIAAHLDVQGPIHTTSTGCNSGMDALGLAAQTIQLGMIDAAIVVGSDCELAPEVLALLNASASLATRWNDEPTRSSRPFDVDRDGNVIGEGAGAVIVESEAHAAARGVQPYARVAGYAMCSSGLRRYHATDPEIDIQPSARALKAAMCQAGWSPSDVQLISANGSSSRAYDRFEGMAFCDVFGAHLPQVPVYSTKSALGQHGAGSSSLQLAAACLTMRHRQIPPVLNCDRLDPECGPLNVVRARTDADVERVLAHAIGFGGFYYSALALAAAVPPSSP
jgi:3-oxoacyl-[acyl-carrier-protein] synthase II